MSTDGYKYLERERGGQKMADKPSRALVIYGSGMAAMVNSSHEGLNSLAILGACGFLALRSGDGRSFFLLFMVSLLFSHLFHPRYYPIIRRL